MNSARDLYRIDLRAAKLCMELDCNTIFDSAMSRHCPNCSSVESYPLEVWLNRERSKRVPAAADAVRRGAAARFETPRRALRLESLQDKPEATEGRGASLPVRLRARGERRRAG